MSTLIVVAKEPIPGRVKTRLVPPLTYADAATLAGAALLDTFDNVADHPATLRVLAFDGNATNWAPPTWQVQQQPAGGLDRRLAAAFAHAVSGPAVLVGMDTPQVRVEQLTVFNPDRYDACLGLAADGGFWTVGFADPCVAGDVMVGVPMSSADTGSEQLRRMRNYGLRVQLLDELTDVDDIDTAEQVAATIPNSRFAHALLECAAGV